MNTPHNKPHVYASFRDRITALLFDIIICGIFFFILSNILDWLGFLMDKNIRRIINLEVFYLYNVFFLYYYGTTIGKKMRGLKVITKDGKKPDIRNILVREIIGKQLTNLLTFGIVNLWMLFDKNRQTPYDILARTYVVKIQSNTK